MPWVKVIPSARTLPTIFLLSSDLDQEADNREQLLQFSRLEIITSLYYIHTFLFLPNSKKVLPGWATARSTLASVTE